jgi:hypothetical protein
MMPNKNKIQPAIKNNPPIGVSMPKGPSFNEPMLISDIAYSDPLNSKIPTTKHIDAC